MEDRAWRRRGHVTKNGVDSVRLPAKIFLKDILVDVLALELLRISSSYNYYGYNATFGR
jgi:hypothetical protein